MQPYSHSIHSLGNGLFQPNLKDQLWFYICGSLTGTQAQGGDFYFIYKLISCGSSHHLGFCTHKHHQVEHTHRAIITTSEGILLRSSKGVSRVFESTFRMTTSSNPRLLTLCRADTETPFDQLVWSVFGDKLGGFKILVVYF